jgi:hypothetical protein
MTRKLKQCPKCGNNSWIWEEGGKFQNSINSSLKVDKNQITEQVEFILKSSQDAYEKKVALFNFVKNIEVGEIEPSEEQRINCLLEGKFYNEIAKEKMKEYKKLTVADFSKN